MSYIKIIHVNYIVISVIELLQVLIKMNSLKYLIEINIISVLILCNKSNPFLLKSVSLLFVPKLFRFRDTCIK